MLPSEMMPRVVDRGDPPYDDVFEKRYDVLAVSRAAEPTTDQLPDEFLSAMAWEPYDFRGQEQALRIELESQDVEEIDAAVKFAVDHAIPPNRVTAATFRLPLLQAKLKDMQAAILEGPGFFTIQGLNPAKYTPEENVLLQIGLCSYMGNRRAMQYNDHRGSAPALLHVTDLSDKPSPKLSDDFLLPVQNTGAIGFHNDQGDIVSLYCRTAAKQGGELCLSSGWTIYNELTAKHPDVVKTLTQPWQWQNRRSTRSSDLPETTEEPLIHIHKGKLIFRLMKAPLEGSEASPRDARLRPLTPEQVHALKVVDSLACKHAIALTLQAGDMVFFNNLALLHSRNKYLEHDGQYGLKRHMTRVIVRDDERGWSIPKPLERHWNHWYDHDPASETIDVLPKRTYTNENSGHG